MENTNAKREVDSASLPQVAAFGGGNFWGHKAIFHELRGVSAVISGYAGGTMSEPSYETVSSGKTGHAEVIKIEFDPTIISYEILLEVFFASHDPTTKNRQGADVGEQYRSVILYTSEEQKNQAEAYIAKLKDSGEHAASVVTEVKPLEKFFLAEEYHQDYFANNSDQPYCQIIINPKLEKIRKQFSKFLASSK